MDGYHDPARQLSNTVVEADAGETDGGRFKPELSDVALGVADVLSG